MFRHPMPVVRHLLILLLLALPVSAVDYLRDLKPVLRARCYSCHGALKQKAGLRLDTAGQILRGGTEGPVVRPGHPEQSRLLSKISARDESERMPPEGEPLTAGQIAAIREWIAMGAPVPADEPADEDPRAHWAYQPIVRPAVPRADGPVANPIDAFLNRRQRELNLKPQPPADRGLLLRRVSLDLTGLSPTREQLRAFVADSSPHAYAAVVNRLLESPHHGERWGRHWLDVWRYSDWYGLGKQLRNSQKHLWRWRDWVVNSLNDDKGYDRMILEMLAGDELEPANPDVIAGTGFLARNYYLFNRTTWLDDTIEHTAKAFLGITMNCVKCHAHKYDPLEHEDYYRFRAFFEPHQVRLDAVPGELDFEKDGLPRVFDDQPDAPTFVHLKGDEKNPDKTNPVAAGLPALFDRADFKIEPVALPRSAFAPGTRKYVHDALIAAARDRVRSAEAKLATARQAVARAPAVEGAIVKGPVVPQAVVGAATLIEEFKALRESVWVLHGEGWEFRDGALHQTRPGRDNYLRSKSPHPADFAATLRFTTTGGATYKSVGLRFDVSPDGRDQHTVYASAHAPGPKVQVAHGVGGRVTYPTEGRVLRKIELGHEHTLEVKVRDRLLNVSLDGEFLLAYPLPVRRPEGLIELMAFDVTAVFHHLTVRPLAAAEKLVEPKTAVVIATPAPKGDVKRLLRLAELEHAFAIAELTAVESRIAADQIRYADGAMTGLKSAAMKAAGAEARAEVARLEWQVGEKREDAKALDGLNKQLVAARKRLADPGEKYTSIAGSKKALETPEHKEGQYAPVYPATSTGRRLALARWMAGAENPLTARVAVNHVWLRHFGEPLVESVFDFGRRAARPEHLELLDWLAAEFIASGWSMKHLHRLMVTSAAYQRTSSNRDADPATLAADPGNRSYWRMNPRRMESELIRDNLLHLAGALKTGLGGPAIDPNQKDTNGRRSIYFAHGRDDLSPFLGMFDDADFLQCYRRSESIVPQQALALANSAISLRSAGDVARRILADDAGPADEAFVRAAFETVLGRLPNADELAASADFFRELESLGKPDVRRARLVHALLNHNDFLTVR